VARKRSVGTPSLATQRPFRPPFLPPAATGGGSNTFSPQALCERKATLGFSPCLNEKKRRTDIFLLQILRQRLAELFQVESCRFRVIAWGAGREEQWFFRRNDGNEFTSKRWKHLPLKMLPVWLSDRVYRARGKKLSASCRLGNRCWTCPSVV